VRRASTAIRAISSDLGLGYGDGNTLVHAVLQSDGTRAAAASEMSTEDVPPDLLGPAACGPSTRR
jgi:hypothetical protein